MVREIASMEWNNRVALEKSGVVEEQRNNGVRNCIIVFVF